MAFLPPLAYHQYKVAREHKLINDLGTPNVSSFVAYAYSAGLHIDKDVCVSHGWVVERPSKVSLKYVHYLSFLTQLTRFAGDKKRIELCVRRLQANCRAVP
jgi:hypothetical protein